MILPQLGVLGEVFLNYQHGYEKRGALSYDFHETLGYAWAASLIPVNLEHQVPLLVLPHGFAVDEVVAVVYRNYCECSHFRPHWFHQK